MNTRRTGRGWKVFAVRCTNPASSTRAREVNATCPSTPAVARPALRCVTCRTLTSVFDQLRSIIFCRFLTVARSPAFDALKILHRSRRTSSSCMGHTIASQSRSSPSGPFTVTVSNLPFGSGTFSFKGSPATRQPAFAAGHQARYPASYTRTHRLERPATDDSRFPAAFRLPAFASWASCSRHGIPLPSRSAYHHTTWHSGPDGVSTFRTHERRPGRVPAVPREQRCPHDRESSSVAACRFSTARSLSSPPHDPTRGVAVTRHHHWFTHAHPSGLPLTCDNPVGAGALGLPPGLRTRPLLALK
jgi:hypothetical protein